MMTKAATVVRHNDQLRRRPIDKVSELAERAKRCSLSDTGNWTNQNVVFTKALLRHVPAGQGDSARARCRATNAAVPTTSRSSTCPASTATDPAERRRAGRSWCDRFEDNNAQVAQDRRSPRCEPDGEPKLSYEDVDTSLIPPRPRLYGLVGAEVIEEVWKERQAAQDRRRRTATATPAPQAGAAAASSDMQSRNRSASQDDSRRESRRT